jgi:hypothetical protein
MMSDNWLAAAAAPRRGGVLPEASVSSPGALPTTAATAVLVSGSRLSAVPAGAGAACLGSAWSSTALLLLLVVVVAAGDTPWLLVSDSSEMMYSMRKSADQDSLGDSKQTLAAAATACKSVVLSAGQQEQAVHGACGNHEAPS